MSGYFDAVRQGHEEATALKRTGERERESVRERERESGAVDDDLESGGGAT